MKVKLAVLSLIFLLSSCLGTRYLKEDESILHKQKVKTSKAVDRDEIEPFFAQEPNTHFFIFPFTHTVYLYKIGENHFDSLRIVRKRQKIVEKYDAKIAEEESKERQQILLSKKLRKTDKKDTKLKEGNLFMRWGEPLAVFDSSNLNQTRNSLKSYMFTKGYFNARTEFLKFKTKNQKTTVKLRLVAGEPSIMDSLEYAIADDSIRKIFYENLEKQELKGVIYDEDLISAERNRVYNLMTNHGYFDFKRQYVLFEVDSVTLGDHKLIVREIIANPTTGSKHKKYVLDSVTFTTNPNNSFKKYRMSSEYNDITYNLTNNRFYERVVDWRIFTYPGDTYSKRSALETQKQLSYLDMFKFVNINHDTTGGKFVAHIFTSPLNKYETSIEGGLSGINQVKIPGPFVTFNAKNRNVFKGLEILEFNGNASIQALKTDNELGSNSKYSRFQYGGEFTLTFPQFLFPVRDSYQDRIGQYNPKTKLSAGVNFENRLGEFNRTTFNTGMRYQWQTTDNSRLFLQPIDIRFIDSETFGTFADELETLEEAGNISYVSAFKPSFVSGAAIGLDLNFHNYGLGNHTSSYFSTTLEYAGLGQAVFDELDAINKLTTYRYLKGNVDYRQNLRLNRKTALAFRANVGSALVWGGSKSLPYEKYFFAGGSNSIRAWQPRRLGPGSYAMYRRDNNGQALGDGQGKPVVDYDREQPGDILIELSAELRREFVGIIDYALFVDAGNVWLWESDTPHADTDNAEEEGVFMFDSFLSEMAVGAGAGLRLDFSFLVMRLDAAYKIMDPAWPKGERFVLDEIKFSNFIPRLNWNIGIGYPF